MNDSQDFVDEDDVDLQALLAEEENTDEEERPELVQGLTYTLIVPNGQGDQAKVFFTINEHNGRLYEVFINSKSKQIIGRLSSLMISISRQLQQGVDPRVIAEDLLSVLDPETEHYHKQQFHNSLDSRLGATILWHLDNGGLEKLTPIWKTQVLKMRR